MRILFYGLSLLISSLSFGQTLYASTLLQRFTHYAISAQHTWQVPGMAVAIIEQGKLVYARGFGVRNNKNQPVTPNTIFDIASLTKSFSATLLAHQIDQGKYTWNTKITQLYPSFKLYSTHATKHFAVRDLVAHDSGLPPDALSALGNFGYGVDHTLYALRFIKPIAPFRHQFAYQDSFLEVAKKIIEQTNGHTFSETLHSVLFTPLGMTRSFVVTDPQLAQQDNVAQPFVFYRGHNIGLPKTYIYLASPKIKRVGQAGGGIRASVVDLAKWVIFNMNQGVWQGKRIISQDTMHYMHSPQTPIKATNHNSEALGAQAYGEGWYINTHTYAPNTVLFHEGGGTGMHAFMAYSPQAKLGIVVLTNQYGNRVPMALYRWLFDAYLNHTHPKDWSTRLWQQKQRAMHQATPAQAPKCTAQTLSNLSAYTGAYHNPVYGTLKMTQAHHALHLTIGPLKVQWTLTPCTKTLFLAHWPTPGHLAFPMFFPGQNHIMFIFNRKEHITEMTIPYLNGDGSGQFIKKRLLSAHTTSPHAPHQKTSASDPVQTPQK